MCSLLQSTTDRKCLNDVCSPNMLRHFKFLSYNHNWILFNVRASYVCHKTIESGPHTQHVSEARRGGRATPLTQDPLTAAKEGRGQSGDLLVRSVISDFPEVLVTKVLDQHIVGCPDLYQNKVLAMWPGPIFSIIKDACGTQNCSCPCTFPQM